MSLDGTLVSMIKANAGSMTTTKLDVIEVPFDKLPEESEKTADTVRDTLSVFVLAGDLSDDEMAAILALYDKWSSVEVGAEIPKGKLLVYKNTLYKTISKHNKQMDRTPDVAVSLFAKVVPEGIIEEWEQRESTNPYMVGDKVTFEGRIYESTSKDNVWSPAAYPQGWNDLGPA